MQALVDKNTKFVLDSLTDWKPAQLVTRSSEMESNFRFLKTRRAAERRTDCSLFISSLLIHASKHSPVYLRQMHGREPHRSPLKATHE